MQVVEVDSRQEEIVDWLEGMPAFRGGHLTVASADASFRRYFRLEIGKETFVVMDAPPDKEPCEPFYWRGPWHGWQFFQGWQCCNFCQWWQGLEDSQHLQHCHWCQDSRRCQL